MKQNLRVLMINYEHFDYIQKIAASDSTYICIYNVVHAIDLTVVGFQCSNEFAYFHHLRLHLH